MTDNKIQHTFLSKTLSIIRLLKQWYEKLKPILFSPTLIFFMLVLVVGGSNLLLNGEIILESNGFGYEDGIEFREMVLDFPARITSHQVLKYYVQRAFPSLILYSSFKVLGMQPTDTDILFGFRAYNLLLLLISVVVWHQVAKEMKFSIFGEWAAFIGLFVNVFILKLYFYKPVLTDQTAFFLGVLLLYFYLRRQWVWFWIVVLIGAFTWQTMIYYGIVLFLFSNEYPRLNKSFLLSYLRIDVILAALSVMFLLQNLQAGFAKGLQDKWWILDKSVIYLSILIVVIYLWVSLQTLLQNAQIYKFRDIMRSLISLKSVLVIVILAIVTIIINTFGVDSTEHEYMRLFIKNAVNKSIGAPAVFLIAHVVYFGPIVLLTVFFWRRVVSYIQQYSIGLSLFFIGNIFLSLSSETRFLTAAFPFIVVFTVKALEKYALKPSFLWLFFVVSLLFSKVWYRINVAWQDGFSQAYMMNYGPWISPEMYVVQGCAVLFGGMLLYYALHSLQVVQFCEE